MKPQSYSEYMIWQKFDEIVNIEEEKRQNNPYDNDAATLDKERQRFQAKLMCLHPLIRVDHMEKDRYNRDLFVLTVESMKFINAIEALFKDNTVQYQVITDLYQVPPPQIELNRPHHSNVKPLQYTVAIARLPLKRLNRSLPLNLCVSSFYLLLFGGLLVTLYHIVAQ